MMSLIKKRGHSTLFSIVCFVSIASLPTSVLAKSMGAVLAEIPVPPGATLQIVSDSTVHNGISQAMATLQSSNSIDSVLSFYRQAWAEDTGQHSKGYVEVELPTWRIISRLHDSYNIVIQLNSPSSTRGSNGFVSVRAVGVQATAPDHGPFDNLDLLSSTSSIDGVDTSSLRVYASALSVARTHQSYKERLIKKGWGVMADSLVDRNHVMVLTRKQTRLELMFLPSPEYASVLVVHRVDS